MSDPFDQAYDGICRWAEKHGIAIRHSTLERKKPGEFDGISATMNTGYPVEERTYYLAHALGSMVRWSLSRPSVQQMFDELRRAKEQSDRDPARLERALDQYRAFETESSEFAVWLFSHLGHAEVIPSYSNFMSADLEALSQFHRTGKAPVWRDFFDNWNDEMRRGERKVPSFAAKPIPPFEPLKIELQEILQEQPSS